MPRRVLLGNSEKGDLECKRAVAIRLQPLPPLVKSAYPAYSHASSPKMCGWPCANSGAEWWAVQRPTKAVGGGAATAAVAVIAIVAATINAVVRTKMMRLISATSFS